MNKDEVGSRLRKFLLEKFGKLTIGAENIGMSPQSLQKYLKGEFIPGGEIISKLSELGCDIEWLLLRKENPSDNSGNGNESLNRKDKIILSQAEELTMMKVKLEELKQRILELEEDQSRLMKDIGKNKVEKIRGKGIREKS